jgi:hypothetical protein
LLERCWRGKEPENVFMSLEYLFGSGKATADIIALNGSY